MNGPSGQLFVDDGGAGGLPVVFLHAAAGSSEHWAAQLTHLRRTRRAVALDLRGHGRSQPPADGDYGIASLAKDVAAVVDGLGLDRFVLVGHSMGGMVAAAYAGKHARRVAGLFLLDPASDGRKIPPAVVEQMMAGLRADVHAATEAYWTPMLGPHPAVRARLLRDLRATPGPVIAGPLTDMLTFDPITPLQAYQGPRLSVITAANEMPSALHAQVPDFPWRKVEGTGHWVQLDDPALVNRLLDEFLATID